MRLLTPTGVRSARWTLRKGPSIERGARIEMEPSAKLEVRRAKTVAETEVRLAVPGEMKLDQLLKVQQRIFEEDLPRLIPGFASCGNCKSGLGRFIVDTLDPRVLVQQESPLRTAGRLRALEIENAALRSLISSEGSAIDIDTIEVRI